MRRSLLAVAATALALGGLVTPAAHATGSCGSAPAVVGVATGTVSPSDADWYHYESLVGVHVVALVGAPAAVELAVYDGSCTLLCGSATGTLEPQVCPITTPTLVLNVRVALYAGPFDSAYVLTVA